MSSALQRKVRSRCFSAWPCRAVALSACGPRSGAVRRGRRRPPQSRRAVQHAVGGGRRRRLGEPRPAAACGLGHSSPVAISRARPHGRGSQDPGASDRRRGTVARPHPDVPRAPTSRAPSHLDVAAPPSPDRIVIDPSVRSGRPSVRGTRISVGDVLSYLAAGMREDAILTDLPQLAREDTRAGLAFAAERARSTWARRAGGTATTPSRDRRIARRGGARAVSRSRSARRFRSTVRGRSCRHRSSFGSLPAPGRFAGRLGANARSVGAPELTAWPPLTRVGFPSGAVVVVSGPMSAPHQRRLRGWRGRPRGTRCRRPRGVLNRTSPCLGTP